MLIPLKRYFRDGFQIFGKRIQKKERDKVKGSDLVNKYNDKTTTPGK